jgi:hypothetical protein
MMTKETAMKLISSIFVCTVLCCLSLSGCGGSSSTTTQQQKTATIVFSTVSGAHVAPLQGIQVAMTLPAGVTATDVTGHNSSSWVSPGIFSGNTASFAVTQSYFQPQLDFITFGDFATLKCNISNGVTLDQSSFSLAPGDVQMTGKDGNGNTPNITTVPVKISVSFGY